MLIFVALFLIAMLGVMALAIDVGVILVARSEAQRAADSGALAGAGLFRTHGVALTPAQIKPLAEDTARTFASLNSVRGEIPDSVGVQVWELERRVGVEVIGTAPVFFARFLGQEAIAVRAYAEARVAGAATVDCVKPFALPDMWQSGATENLYDPVLHADEIPLWAPGFSPARGDYYEKWNGSLTHATATGYGAPRRNGEGHNRYMHDAGRKVIFKIGSHPFPPELAEVPTFEISPAQHFLIDMGEDRTAIPGISCNSGNPVTRDICQCNNDPIGIGSQVHKEPGNVANTTSGLEKLLDADPGLTWDGVNDRVVDGVGNPVTSSPRLMKMVLYDPVTALATAGDQNGALDVTNIGIFFLEGFDQQGQNVNVWGRFLMFAEGTGVGPGTTALSLQLVK